MPWQAELINLAEIDDRDVRQTTPSAPCSACNNAPVVEGSLATTPDCPASRSRARTQGWRSRSRAPAAQPPKPGFSARSDRAGGGPARPRAGRPGSPPARRCRAIVRTAVSTSAEEVVVAGSGFAGTPPPAGQASTLSSERRRSMPTAPRLNMTPGTRLTISQSKRGSSTRTVPIFSMNARPSRMPTATRHRRASCSYRPFQNARAVAAHIRRPGTSVSIRWAWP